MLISLIGFVALLVILVGLARKGLALSTRVLLALVLGLAFGSLLQAFYGSGGDALATVLSWTNLVGSAYVSLLKVIIMPLILVAMIAAVLRLEALSTLGRVGGSVLAVLLGTTLIAAMIGGLLAAGFNLSVDGLVEGERELARAAVLVERQDRVADLSVPALLVSFLPTNIFSDLAGSRPTSIIAVVIFAILIGIAGLRLRAVAPEEGQALKRGIDIAQDWVMHLVRLVIALTPYGVLALMTKVAASSDSQDIWNLLEFIAVSYLAIFLMFGVHGLLVSLTGLSPIAFFKKAFPALVFAFTSRSSAATIPLNIETQVKALGNHPSIASLSASFGATIGQNGCAGIYQHLT